MKKLFVVMCMIGLTILMGITSIANAQEWTWVSGEPVTYYRHDYSEWGTGGPQAYLHLANHSSPGTWNANPLHNNDYDYQAKGIIEVSPDGGGGCVPVPDGGGGCPVYMWYEYNGHVYTLTSDWGTWSASEAEAVSLGGHLVTISDANENAWLTDTFKDTYNRSHYGESAQNIAWTGYNVASDGNPGDGSGGSGSPVAPEPISSILFVTGGTFLAGMRLLRNKA